MRWLAVAAGLVLLFSAPASAETILVPAISIAERYDTNVFFIGVGQKLTDYVTTTTPSLLVDHKGRIVEGSATVSVFGEVYAKNPGLNYVGTSGVATLNLDQIVGRLDRRASMRFTDSVSYTPRPPGFVAPDTGSVVPPEFVRGIQSLRANSIRNVATVSGAYALDAANTLLASYTNTYFRFGNFFAPQGTTGSVVPGVAPGASPFFTTRFSIVTFGPEMKLTARDTMTAEFRWQDMSFTGNGQEFGFQTRGGLLGWKRRLTSQWTGSVSAGLSLLTPGNTVQYLANASLEWVGKNSTVTMSYSRTVFPSFFLAAAPLLSQIISVGGTYKLSDPLTATASASYARNETIGATVPAQFESYVVSIGGTYTFSRTVTSSLTYSHYQFIQGFVNAQYSFNRDVLMLTLRKEWR